MNHGLVPKIFSKLSNLKVNNIINIYKNQIMNKMSVNCKIRDTLLCACLPEVILPQIAVIFIHKYLYKFYVVYIDVTTLNAPTLKY